MVDAERSKCTAKCEALLTEFRSTIPDETATAKEQAALSSVLGSGSKLLYALQMFCKVPPTSSCPLLTGGLAKWGP